MLLPLAESGDRVLLLGVVKGKYICMSRVRIQRAQSIDSTIIRGSILLCNDFDFKLN